jgi:hypothetical protein
MKNFLRAKEWMLAAIAIAVAGLAGTVAGQTATPDTQPKMWVAMRKDIPFVATSMTMLQRRLADGTMVKASSEDIVARDSMGRCYSDQHRVTGRPESKNIPYRPNVSDPITHRFMHFVPPTRRVMVAPLAEAPAEPKPVKATTVQRHGAVTVKTEALPEQTLLGFAAWGQRVTTTIVREGKTVVILDEVWYSRELGMDLLRRHVDPVSGEEVTAIMELHREQPDPALFEIPQGWEELETQ